MIVENDKGVEAADLAEHRSHAPDNSLGILRSPDGVLDQMCDDFRIGFADERVASLLKPFTELSKILDDSIMDNRKSAGAIDVRMGVFVSNAAVRCPSGVSKSNGSVRERWIGCNDASRLLGNLDRSVLAYSNAPGIVSTIFEASQALQQHSTEGLFATDVAYDSAHKVKRPFSGRLAALCQHQTNPRVTSGVTHS